VPCGASYIAIYNVSCSCYCHPLHLRLCAIVSSIVISFITSFLTFLTSDSPCGKAWTSIASDPAASTCLSVSQLLPIVAAAQNNASLVSPVTNWLTSLCSQPACSKDTISAVYKLVTTKCPPAEDWADFDPAYYPTWRKVVCLKKFAVLSLLSWTVSDFLSQCKWHALYHRAPYKH